jgi:EAL domain-containing protein (putative c-di-GMP-specific phosphodiesterase class I)
LFDEALAIGGQDVFVSASIGVAVYPTDGTDAEALLKSAGTAMHQVKGSGGAEVRFYTDDLNVDALERVKLEGELRRAITANEFELHYQPRINLASDRVTSVEALVRWNHPRQGMIAPGRFIPLAEETGLIVPLGLWVLRTACVQMRAWLDAGMSLSRVAVNLSARQFRQPDLLPSIHEALAHAGLEACHLELEITESVAMNNPADSRVVMQALSDAGIALAIDDFGTGYSSLAYLKQFPIDYLKIDQSFVRGVPADHDDSSIVRAVIALGKTLELTLIAEGVETEDQRNFLLHAGCEEAQGYLLCKPALPSALESLLGKGSWRV